MLPLLRMISGKQNKMVRWFTFLKKTSIYNEEMKRRETLDRFIIFLWGG